MKLDRLSNTISCEFEMQDKFKSWLNHRDIEFVDEHLIKDINRIADFLAIRSGKLVNIEAKSNDFSCLIKQLIDHSSYCDYSFAFIPDYSLTPKIFKKELLKYGFGLIVFNYDLREITEVLEAHHNKPSNKNLRHRVIQDIKVKSKYSFDNLYRVEKPSLNIVSIKEKK